MIKVNFDEVEIHGGELEILNDLSLIIYNLKYGVKISEKDIDSAIELGKMAKEDVKEKTREMLVEILLSEIFNDKDNK